MSTKPNLATLVIDMEDKTNQTTPPIQSPTPSAPPTKQPQEKSLNEILQIAKQKGEQARNAPVSLDNMAKSAWKNSTGIRSQLAKGLSTAYSIATGLTNKEVRKEVKQYIQKTQAPNATDKK